MAVHVPLSAGRGPVLVSPRKPRVLLAACGSIAALKFASLCRCFTEWAEVKAVGTRASLPFMDLRYLPEDVIIYTDGDEWSTWRKLGDNVLHTELRIWADIIVIAPLSANTLGKIAGGVCDNLLTCIVRAWDYAKPIFVAPVMSQYMWQNPFTERHLLLIRELGITLIPHIMHGLGMGAMTEPSYISSTVKRLLESRYQ